MRLVEQSNFDELSLEVDGIKLSLKRGAPVEGSNASAAVVEASDPQAAKKWPPAAAAESSPPSAGGAPSPDAPPSHRSSSSAGGRPSLGGTSSPGADTTVAATADPNVHEVASPLLGTFYRAPKPGAPPFVEVGAQVEEVTVVAIIEVMKLMNTVRAGVRGTVTEILVADGALAEYGETLLRVSKTG
jgi:acetyl-CoA carboxylase biotin carboxyl carrier protein